MKLYTIIFLTFVLAACSSQESDTAPISGSLGPIPYLGREDSPFNPSDFAGGSFHLEDFEDGQLNTPGVVSTDGSATKALYPASLMDSVDADDGNRDDKCTGCDSWFGDGVQGINFTFSDLPTHVGIVWTDAGSGASITFEAFDAGEQKIATIGGVVADDSNFGTTAEDRFFGVIHPAGVSRIRVSASAGGLELDHLQYGKK